MLPPTIDLNCDMGEGCGRDADLMPFVTSANIACGGHAGSIATMREALGLAREHGVAAGAHPGFVDPGYFGRRELPVSPREAGELVTEQVERLRGLGPVRHVKLHGGLYHLANRDSAIAAAVVEAVRSIDPALILIGSPGGALLRRGREAGLRTAAEGFADRAYAADGGLSPRETPGAVIDDPGAAAEQVLGILSTGRVRTAAGGSIGVRADTICVHGDNPQAPKIIRRLVRELQAAGIRIEPLRRDQPGGVT